MQKRTSQLAPRCTVDPTETVRAQFLVEVEARPPANLAELNRLFSAWVETVYHRRAHSETGEAPIERLLAGGAPALPSPAALHEAFLWSEARTVTKVATVSLHGNTFEVDAALVGSRVEIVFDPFAMEAVEVRFQGRPMGQGLPVVIGRHSHPQARAEALQCFTGLVRQLPVYVLELGRDLKSTPAVIRELLASLPE